MAESAAREWWRDLDPGRRARLRRAHDAVAAAPYAIDLYRRWGGDLGRVAVVAAVLAGVKADGGHPATVAMSDGRFERILRARTDDELLRAFRSLVRLAGGAVSVSALAWAMRRWDRDDVRLDWVMRRANQEV